MKRDTSSRTRDRTNTQVCRYHRMHFLDGECVLHIYACSGIEPFIDFLEMRASALISFTRKLCIQHVFFSKPDFKYGKKLKKITNKTNKNKLNKLKKNIIKNERDILKYLQKIFKLLYLKETRINIFQKIYKNIYKNKYIVLFNKTDI